MSSQIVALQPRYGKGMEHLLHECDQGLFTMHSLLLILIFIFIYVCIYIHTHMHIVFVHRETAVGEPFSLRGGKTQ